MTSDTPLAPTVKELQLRLAVLIGSVRWVLETVPLETVPPEARPSLGKLAAALQLWDEVTK